MLSIDFHRFDLDIKEQNGQKLVYDVLRRKYIVLTPEELVRQKLVHYLIEGRRYPKSMIKVEGGMRYQKMLKRSDVLVFDRNGGPFLLVECKSFKSPVNQKVLEQASLYNQNYKCQYLMVTNGVHSLIYEMDYDNRAYKQLEDLPEYPT